MYKFGWNIIFWGQNLSTNLIINNKWYNFSLKKINMTYIFWKFNIWITYHLYSWQVCQILYLPSDSGKWNHESLAVTQVSWSKPICYRRADIEPTNPLIDWPTELGWTLSLIIFPDCERCGTNKLMSLLLTVKVICNLVWDLLSILNDFFF